MIQIQRLEYGVATKLAWVKLAGVESSVTDDTITTGAFTAKTNLLVDFLAYHTGDVNTNVIFNSDTGSNYAQRYSFSGGSDGTSVSRANFSCFDSGVHDSLFTINYIINISAQEKLIIQHQVAGQATGAGTAPARAEIVGKWANTASQITEVTCNQSNSGSYTFKSLAVLGTD